MARKNSLCQSDSNSSSISDYDTSSSALTTTHKAKQILKKRSMSFNTMDRTHYNQNSSYHSPHSTLHHHSKSLEPTTTFLDSSCSSSTSLSSKSRLGRKKSVSSLFSSITMGTSPPGLQSSRSSVSGASGASSLNNYGLSAGSTRDNSITSINDMELDMNFHNYIKYDDNYGIKYSSANGNNKRELKRKLSMHQPINEVEIKNYDEIADSILNRISNADVIHDWRI